MQAHVVGDYCLVIHDHNRPVNVYIYDPKDTQKSTKTVDAPLWYQNPQSGQKPVLVINQTICIDCLENHLLCLMQCCLNGVYISEVPKLLAESSSVTTHALELTDPFNAAHC